MLKRGISIIAAAAFCAIMAAPALGTGAVPYDTYNYDYWEYIVFTPAAYVPGDSISGVSLGIGAFQGPQGLCVAKDGTVYIADTGNNRIVVLEPDFLSVAEVIDSFDNNGQADAFARPAGVAVSEDGLLYVADTDHRRVVALDGRTAVKIIENPKSEMLDESYDFVPLKVTVDYAGRVFVIGRNMFQGIMAFNAKGEFIGFFGTIKVKISLWQRLWRALSTKAERAKQQLFIPTEYTGMDVDPAGFVYASNLDTEGVQAVQRLNPKGEDVIKKGENENVGGDIATFYGWSAYAGPSNIVDVVYRGDGIVLLLDSRRGRVYTYDHEGNLLYIFGGLGNQVGTFRQPTAIGTQKGRLLVLDAARNEIITFQETRYGALINEAVALRFDGDEEEAVDAWREVLKLNENFELANAGIGKVYLTAGDNREAMHYLKLGMDKANYSIAFKRYRNEVLKTHLGWILTALLGLGAAYAAWRLVRKRLPVRAGAGARHESASSVRLGYMFGVLSKPIDSFYEIRYRNQGSIPLSLTCVLLLSVSYTLNRIFAGFVVNAVNPRDVNGLRELGAIFLLMGLFCVGNWSVTCLMGGEGRMRDIVTVTGYAMIPIILTLTPATLISRVVAEGEEAFYFIIAGIGIAWTVILLLIGVMTVHNYTLAKTLVTLGLTFVAMLILIFVGLLILDLINQAYGFLYSIYTELIYRF